MSAGITSSTKTDPTARPNVSVTAIGTTYRDSVELSKSSGIKPTIVVTDVSTTARNRAETPCCKEVFRASPVAKERFTNAIKIIESFTMIPERVKNASSDIVPISMPKRKWPTTEPTKLKGIAIMIARGQIYEENTQASIR